MKSTTDIKDEEWNQADIYKLEQINTIAHRLDFKSFEGKQRQSMLCELSKSPTALSYLVEKLQKHFEVVITTK